MNERVAFQGEHGAFSEAAAFAHFGAAITTHPCRSFEEVFSAVALGAADLGVLPCENSIAGSIYENFDLLLAYELPIVGEIMLPVRHCLLARPGARLEELRTCYSHPQALAQCAPFLKRHGLHPQAAYDTAGAARDLARREEPGACAIASALAARHYGLEILAEGIQSRQDNTTRFWVLAPERPELLASEKATLVLGTANRPGSLAACLSIFATHGYNLTKIESRPTRDALWEYHFYVDVEGDLLSERGRALRRELEECAQVRLLGTYPRAAGPTAERSP